MKKIALLACLLLTAACGPSAEDQKRLDTVRYAFTNTAGLYEAQVSFYDEVGPQGHDDRVFMAELVNFRKIAEANGEMNTVALLDRLEVAAENVRNKACRDSVDPTCVEFLAAIKPFEARAE